MPKILAKPVRPVWLKGQGKATPQLVLGLHTPKRDKNRNAAPICFASAAKRARRLILQRQGFLNVEIKEIGARHSLSTELPHLDAGIKGHCFGARPAISRNAPHMGLKRGIALGFRQVMISLRREGFCALHKLSSQFSPREPRMSTARILTWTRSCIFVQLSICLPRLRRTYCSSTLASARRPIRGDGDACGRTGDTVHSKVTDECSLAGVVRAHLAIRDRAALPFPTHRRFANSTGGMARPWSCWPAIAWAAARLGSIPGGRGANRGIIGHGRSTGATRDSLQFTIRPMRAATRRTRGWLKPFARRCCGLPPRSSKADGSHRLEALATAPACRSLRPAGPHACRPAPLADAWAPCACAQHRRSRPGPAGPMRTPAAARGALRAATHQGCWPKPSRSRPLPFLAGRIALQIP